MKYLVFFLVTGYYLLLPCTASPQTASTNNVPSRTNSTKLLPTGPGVLGVFEGRPPCPEIARQLKISVPTDCVKLKWMLTLYHDTNTLMPTTYKLQGSFFRENTREGKWTIIKGTASDGKAIVYQLDPATPQDSFYFLKGDDNVLFILDQNKKLRVGNADYSYTLNRVVN